MFLFLCWDLIEDDFPLGMVVDNVNPNAREAEMEDCGFKEAQGVVAVVVVCGVGILTSGTGRLSCAFFYVLYSFPFSAFHLEYICISDTKYQSSFISLLTVRESSPKTMSDTRTKTFKCPRPWWCMPVLSELKRQRYERYENHCKFEPAWST